MQNIRKKTITMVQFAILVAIEAVFCFTTLGAIPIGPIVATLAMIPVIITGIVMGTWAGTAMGFIAGFFSFIYWSFYMPGPMSFVFTPIAPSLDGNYLSGNFWSLVICFVPRILVGTVAGLVGNAMVKRYPDKEWILCGLAGLLGSIANTVLVLGGISLFFGKDYANLLGGILQKLIMTAVLTNGIPEAVVSVLAATAVCIPLRRILARI